MVYVTIMGFLEPHGPGAHIGCKETPCLTPVSFITRKSCAKNIRQLLSNAITNSDRLFIFFGYDIFICFS